MANKYGYTAPTTYDLSKSYVSPSNLDWRSIVMNNPIKPVPKVPKEALWKQMLGSLSAGGSAVTDMGYRGAAMFKDKGLDGKRTWKDWLGLDSDLNSFADNAPSLVPALVNQGKGWFDGDWNYNDIPVLGTLNRVTEESKHGSDILADHFGVKNGNAQQWGGLGIDILADPLTWLTGGASGAMKTAGKTAALTAAKDAGIAVSKTPGKMLGFIPKKAWDVGDIAEQVGEGALKQHEAANPMWDILGISDDTKGLIKGNASNKVLEAVDAARGAKQNALFSAGIPFGSKIALGEKPAWLRNMARTSTRQVGGVGAAQVTSVLDKLGMDASQQSAFLKGRYNVGHAGELTEEAFQDLIKQTDKTIGRADKFVPTPKPPLPSKPAPRYKVSNNSQSYVTAAMNGSRSQVENILKMPNTKTRLAAYLSEHLNIPLEEVSQLTRRNMEELATEVIQSMSKGEPFVDVVRKVAQSKGFKLDELLSGKTPKVSDKLKWDDLKRKYGVYDAPNNITLKAPHVKYPKSAAPVANVGDDVLQRLLKKGEYSQGEVARRAILPSVFNPRSLGTKDSFVNASANSMRDAETQISGRTNQLNMEEKVITDFVKKNNVTDKEMKEVQYALEGGKLPVGFKATTDPARQKVVSELGSKLKPILDRIGKQGLESGVLDKLRKDYFPHVMTKEGQATTKSNNPLAGLSGVSGYNKERESFETLADLDNFVNGTRASATKAKAAGDTAKYDELTAQADEVEKLFERDSVVATFERARESIRKTAMKELNTTLQEKGFIRKQGENNAKHHNAAEYVALSGKQAKSLGMKAGDLVHADVLKGLEKIDELFTYDKIQDFMDNLQSVTNIWKSLVTTAVPSHFWNNFVGNMFNNALVGVRARDYTAATELMKGFKKGKLDAKGMKLMQEAIDHGAFGQGFTADFKRFTTNGKDGNLIKIEQATRKFMEKTPWAKAGLYGENVTRLANFLHGKATLGSAEKAAQQVRTHLFAYQEMTKGDKLTRIAIPFWNWTKNNLPLQFEQLFKNTRIYQSFNRIKEEWDTETKADNPAWAKDRYWKIPGTEVGVPLNLPLNDLEYATTSPTEGFRKVLSNINPVAKVPIELGANREFYTNKPIDFKANQFDGTGNVSNQAGFDYILKQTGGINKLIELLGSSGDTPEWQSIMGLITGKPFNYKK